MHSALSCSRQVSPKHQSITLVGVILRLALAGTLLTFGQAERPEARAEGALAESQAKVVGSKFELNNSVASASATKANTTSSEKLSVEHGIDASSAAMARSATTNQTELAPSPHASSVGVGLSVLNEGSGAGSAVLAQFEASGKPTTANMSTATGAQELLQASAVARSMQNESRKEGAHATTESSVQAVGAAFERANSTVSSDSKPNATQRTVAVLTSDARAEVASGSNTSVNAKSQSDSFARVESHTSTHIDSDVKLNASALAEGFEFEKDKRSILKAFRDVEEGEAAEGFFPSMFKKKKTTTTTTVTTTKKPKKTTTTKATTTTTETTTTTIFYPKTRDEWLTLYAKQATHKWQEGEGYQVLLRAKENAKKLEERRTGKKVEEDEEFKKLQKEMKEIEKEAFPPEPADPNSVAAKKAQREKEREEARQQKLKEDEEEARLRAEEDAEEEEEDEGRECLQSTGGKCRLLPCAKSRNAKCSKFFGGECVCPEGTCAVQGKCETPEQVEESEEEEEEEENEEEEVPAQVAQEVASPGPTPEPTRRFFMVGDQKVYPLGDEIPHISGWADESDLKNTQIQREQAKIDAMKDAADAAKWEKEGHEEIWEVKKLRELLEERNKQDLERREKFLDDLEAHDNKEEMDFEKNRKEHNGIKDVYAIGDQKDGPKCCRCGPHFENEGDTVIWSFTGLCSFQCQQIFKTQAEHMRFKPPDECNPSFDQLPDKETKKACRWKCRDIFKKENVPEPEMRPGCGGTEACELALNEKQRQKYLDEMKETPPSDEPEEEEPQEPPPPMPPQEMNPVMEEMVEEAHQDIKCNLDTKGTCRFLKCWGFRGATCSAGHCMCETGLCANEGKCLEEAEWKMKWENCTNSTGGTCRLFGCKHSATCMAGKCECPLPLCFFDNQCISDPPQAELGATPDAAEAECNPATGGSCTFGKCKVGDCVARKCMCPEGQCFRDGACGEGGAPAGGGGGEPMAAAEGAAGGGGEAECNPATGGSCMFGKCKVGDCVARKCMCPEGQCFRDGACG